MEYKTRTPFNKVNSLIFCGTKGELLTQDEIRVIHKRAIKRAELRRIRFHDLRHTFASHFAMNGGSLSTLQALLGHSDPKMTLKYAHLAPGHLESQASVVCFSGSEPAKVLKLAKSS